MEHLLELAEEKKYRLLKEELVELNEVDIASFIEELDSERTVIVFRKMCIRDSSMGDSGRS